MFSRHYTKVSENDSYNQYMGELYRVKGEIWEKDLGLDPCDPARDCGHALRLPVNHPGGTMYFYPTPLEVSSVQEITGLDCSDPDDDDPLVTVMKSCYKANIPIARLRELVDHDDVSDNLTYRCPKSSKCLDCQHSNKFRAMSIQERREQAVIEDSVKLDLSRSVSPSSSPS